MIVKAAPGLKVPKEAKPREYITETDAVEVPETAYYLRAIACHDLVPATPEASAPGETAAPAASPKAKKE